jgi:FAD:protein FMN transferase
MKQTRQLMGMPVTVELVGGRIHPELFNSVYAYFTKIDNRFSTYKTTSEISRLNAGLVAESNLSPDMQTVLRLCEQTRHDTNGYFNIVHNGRRDPSGLVKGWAIYRAARILWRHGCRNFTVEAGGDIQAHGVNSAGTPWRVGIRNPFDRNQIVKTVAAHNVGVATSGTAIRGQHVYDPHHPSSALTEVVSLTVIGPNIYEADRFATAAFAMGTAGIAFIEQREGLEGYMIAKDRVATMTSGFETYVTTS